MRIIKQGNKQPELSFRCHNCECEFVCERNEIEESYYTNDCTVYVHACPCCGDACYRYEFKNSRYERISFR